MPVRGTDQGRRLVKTSIEFPYRIALDKFETAAGREIPNYQEHSIMDYGDVQAKWALYQKRFPGALPRTREPTGVYNCHGYVFASGRTGIDHGRDVRMILEDDGYVKIDQVNAMPGDVVLYIGPDGDVDHSALLVQTAAQSVTAIAVVVSKWGNFVEFMHSLSQCPYESENVEYWRLGKRPQPAPQPIP